MDQQNVRSRFLAASALQYYGDVSKLLLDTVFFDTKRNSLSYSTQCQMASGLIERAVNLRLISFEGLVRSGLVACRSTDYLSEYKKFLTEPRFKNLNQTLLHIAKEARRVVTCLEKPNGYIPRSKSLYTNKPEPDHCSVTLYREPPEGWDPLLP